MAGDMLDEGQQSPEAKKKTALIFLLKVSTNNHSSCGSRQQTTDNKQTS
jgi:hypothetical protein